VSSELTRVILGSLILKPSLLKATDLLTHNLFLDVRDKTAFEIIDRIYEDGQPEEIDRAILIERLGSGDGSQAFVYSLTDGLYHLSTETFIERVLELKRKNLSRRLASQLKKELATESKTGILDLTEIRAEFDELDRLLFTAKKEDIISLAAVEPKIIDWLWQGRVPKAMLTLLCGDPGVGKSICSIGLAARLSQGLPLPDSQNLTQTCSSLFILGEDPVAQAVRPRADANGADCSKIFIFQEPGFHLTDIAKIRPIVERNKDIGLIVIDPLTAFFPPKTKYFEDPSVRAALLPLAGFAEESGVAVKLIAHFRKAEAEAAIHRVAGSVGLAGIARSILAIMRDEDDPERRLLMSLKSNYSKRPAGLAFTIGQDLKVVFEAAPVEVNTEDVLSSSEKRQAVNEHKFNVHWLLDFLKDGPKTFQEIEKESPGISRRTLFRLADKLEQNGKLERVPGTEGRFKIWRLSA